MAEHRISDRRRVFKAGKIIFNKDSSVIDCTIRNVSQTGAMISVPNAVTVPQEFELRWDANTELCAVVWRKVDGVGVKFDKHCELPAKPTAGPPAVAELSAELRNLRWTGEVPPRKWMDFYSRVLSKFADRSGIKVTVSVEIAAGDGISDQTAEETRNALKELGLDEKLEQDSKRTG